MKFEYTEENLHEILEVEITEDPYSKILEICKNAEQSASWKLTPFYSMFKQLVLIMGRDGINYWINGNIEYFKENGGKSIENLFAQLHKNFRQVDMFDGYINTKNTDDGFDYEKSEKAEEQFGPQGINGNLDMLMYDLINSSEIPYLIIKEATVSADNIAKWEVVKRELEKEQTTQEN